MLFGVGRRGIVAIGLGRLFLVWMPPWESAAPLGEYLWSYLPSDSDGIWWLRVLGLELSWRRTP